MTTNGSVGKKDHCGCADKSWRWNVHPVLMPQSSIKYAVLILNRPITQNQKFIKELWNKATIRITIDGGTNQWDSFVRHLSEDDRKCLKPPDLVTGDFDSIKMEILEEYRKKGSKVINTPDNRYTDFTKALMELNIYSHSVGIEMEHVIAICQSSGRLDQVIGNVQTLFLVNTKLLLKPNTAVYLLSDDMISWLLQPGEHVITVPETLRKHKKAICSLVPIGEPCQHVTSTGLKWNLDDQLLQFGQLVSTSNAFDGSAEVTVKCSHSLLWSMRASFIMGS